MKILFVGDVHGRIFHLLALARHIQSVEGHQVACIIQVGDMGAFPSGDRVDSATLSFASSDPSELDFVSFINAAPSTIQTLSTVKQDLATTVLFLRGDHEDHPWLDSLSGADGSSQPVSLGPLGIVSYVPDFSIIDCCGLSVGFASGIAANPVERPGQVSVRWDGFGTHKPLDILVTHHPPFGVSVGYKGLLQGSKYVTELISATQPRFHFFGHLHQTLGPFRIGRTVSMGLSQLVQPLRNNPQQDILPGSLGLFDIGASEFHFVMEEWLSLYNRHMKLPELLKVAGRLH